MGINIPPEALEAAARAVGALRHSEQHTSEDIARAAITKGERKK